MKKEEREKTEALLKLINDYTHKLVDPAGVPERIVKDILLGHIRDFYEQIDGLDLSIEWDEQEMRQQADHRQEQEPATPSSAREQQEEEQQDDAMDEMKKSLEKLKKQFETIGTPEKEADGENKESEESPEKQLEDYPEKSGETHQPASQNEVPENKAPERRPGKQEKAPHETTPKNSNVGIGEKYNDDKSSVNDRLSLNNGDNSIGERMKHHHVANLKTAIDINHKFLFIRELFEGNSEAYNQAIDQLNEAPDMQKAQAILSGYHDKYNWDEKSSALELFLDVIKRRY